MGRDKLKIVSGLLLMFASVLGVVFGKNAKDRTIRISIYLLSLLTFGVGFYLFIAGIDGLAVGVVGKYELGGKSIQPITYNSPEDFKAGLEGTFRSNKEIRREIFRCEDGSKKIVVYNTALGIFGVPDVPVKCDDGTYLIEYKELI